MAPAQLTADVEFASAEDVSAATELMLQRLGMTFEELALDARNDDFRSERARTAWMMIGPEFLAD